MEIKPISSEIMEILMILFLPNLSDNLPKRTTASIEKKIPENMIRPIWSNLMPNSSAKTGIMGAIDTLAMPRMKLSLKKDIIILSSFFKSGFFVAINLLKVSGYIKWLEFKRLGF